MSRNDWEFVPYTTPSGHTYRAPTTFDEVQAAVVDQYQGVVEGWAEDEQIPEPTWGIVGIACEEVARLRGVLAQVAAVADEWNAHAPRYSLHSGLAGRRLQRVLNGKES